MKSNLGFLQRKEFSRPPLMVVFVFMSLSLLLVKHQPEHAL